MSAFVVLSVALGQFQIGPTYPNIGLVGVGGSAHHDMYWVGPGYADWAPAASDVHPHGLNAIVQTNTPQELTVTWQDFSTVGSTMAGDDANSSWTSGNNRGNFNLQVTHNAWSVAGGGGNRYSSSGVQTNSQVFPGARAGGYVQYTNSTTAAKGVRVSTTISGSINASLGFYAGFDGNGGQATAAVPGLAALGAEVWCLRQPPGIPDLTIWTDVAGIVRQRDCHLLFPNEFLGPSCMVWDTAVRPFPGPPGDVIEASQKYRVEPGQQVTLNVNATMNVGSSASIFDSGYHRSQGSLTLNVATTTQAPPPP